MCLGEKYFFVDMRAYTGPTIIEIKGNKILGGDIYAAISSLTWRKIDTYTGKPQLFFKGVIEGLGSDDGGYYLVSVESIYKTAFLIPNIGGNNGEVIIMRPCNEWSRVFCGYLWIFGW